MRRGGRVRLFPACRQASPPAPGNDGCRAGGDTSSQNGAAGMEIYPVPPPRWNGVDNLSHLRGGTGFGGTAPRRCGGGTVISFFKLSL